MPRLRLLGQKFSVRARIDVDGMEVSTMRTGNVGWGIDPSVVCICAVELCRPHYDSSLLLLAKGELQPQHASDLLGVRKTALSRTPGQVPVLAYAFPPTHSLLQIC